MNNRLLPLATLGLCLALAACVDTTGLSASSSRIPKGNPNAAVVVSEFADLQCPACKAAHTVITQPLVEKYGNQIRFEFRHFPLRNIHRFALDLAEGAECSADQGKFWEFVDAAFAKQEELKKGSITEWAASLSLDMDLFGRCTASHIKRPTILAEYDQGTAAGVRGTPTYFVNGTQVDSTMEALSEAIDAAQKAAMEKL